MNYSKVLFSASMLLLLSFSNVGAQAQSDVRLVEGASVNSLQAYRFAACSYWNYSSEANGFVCTSYPPSVEVPDARSVSAQLNQLQSKIDELEARVRKLEGR